MKPQDGNDENYLSINKNQIGPTTNVTLKSKIKSLEDKIAKKWTLDDEIKLNSYKASVELNEALIDMYTDPEAYLERVTTAYSAVNKLIDYKREMDTYNKKLDGNPLRKTLQGQYKIVGTKPTAEIKQFVKEYIVERKARKLFENVQERFYDALGGYVNYDKSK